MAKKYQVIGSLTPETTNANHVVFDKDLITTTSIGNVELINGQAAIPAKGKTLLEVWESIFVKELNPETVKPSILLDFDQIKKCEVGTTITPSYSASLKPGSYSFGPDTGVEVSSWEITDTAGNKSVTDKGSFPDVQITDNVTYAITAKATYTDGTVPSTNIGNEYIDGQIKAGSVSVTSESITGFRNSFYGTVTSKEEITSDVIRSLSGKSGKALTNGSSFTVNIPIGAKRVVIAYPATLRDLTSVKDVNGLNAEIAGSFTSHLIDVEGADHYSAISYKVYVLEFASGNDTINKFTVQI